MSLWSLIVFAQSNAEGRGGILLLIGVGLVVVIGAIAVGVIMTTLRSRRLARIADEISCRACGSLDVDGDERCNVCGFHPRLEHHPKLREPLSRIQRIRYARDNFALGFNAMRRSRNLAVADLANVGGGEASRDAMEDGQNALMQGWQMLEEVLRDYPELVDVELADLRIGEGVTDIFNLFAAQKGLKSLERLHLRTGALLEAETARFREAVREAQTGA